MKFKVIIFIVFIFFVGCKKNESKFQAEIIQNPVSEKIIYNFINSALIENRVYKSCPNILETKRFIYENIDESELNYFLRNLKENDSTFIENQLISREKFYWKENLLANKKVIKIDTTANTDEAQDKSWKNTLSKYKCVLFINQPIFNKGLNLAIVKIQNSEYLETVLFQFINGKWKKIKVLEIGIID
ncbi:hypothetical protein IV494_10815 [Kaistella sp. G5-32]|uniref:Lipoprotein n=1 Tax=Kaistella gelatinilytica TaxID=2787636 RepID=A0ABS0FD86_9FLAO|nr:hypothetical protein [Kaistella gelatinilytica]MBF8457670.1 hypothetical protein [Kaistella gelatinilytica]